MLLRSLLVSGGAFPPSSFPMVVVLSLPPPLGGVAFLTVLWVVVHSIL